MMKMSTTTASTPRFRSALRTPTTILRRSIEAAVLVAVGCSTPSLAAQSAQAPSSKTSGSSSFVFDASSIRHSANPALRIRVGEKISRQALKRRFAGYDVRYTKGEGCLICAVITGLDGQFDVGFDKDGQTVLQLLSTDNRIRDAMGNEIGSPLKSALGAETTTCDAGESTTCASTALEGLSYIVAEEERCPIAFQGTQPTEIPACARIGGFQLFSSESTSKAPDTYNYICKDQGQSWSLKVDAAKNVLEWRNMVYRIKETENCAKFGWRAQKDGVSFDFCTATQGYADYQLNGRTVQCSLKRR
jgi:hypothetical protein